MPSLPFPNVGEFRDAIQNSPHTAGRGEQGFAATYDYSPLKNLLWNYGALAPIGAGAVGLWYLNQKEKARAKKKPAVQPQAMLKAAAPDLKQILENIRWHLPKIRVPDTVAGAALGGGAGALYDALRGPDETGKRRTGKRMLTGALAGAGLTNLIGDRARRYVSNTKVPIGYSNTFTALKPSLGRIWRAGILDKQDFDKQDLGTNDPRFLNTALAPRYELVRRQFGLPIPNADNAFFQKNPEGYYSLNEQSPDYQKRLQQLFGSFFHKNISRRGHAPPAPGGGPDRVLLNPQKALTDFNNNGPSQKGGYDFFGVNQLMGGMQLPYVKNPDGGVSGMVLDRWDQTWAPKERKFFKANLGNMLTNSKWRKAPVKEHFGAYVNEGTGHTNSATMQQLAGRWVWDNILSDELPWVGQKFKVAPRTTPRTFSEVITGKNAPYAFQFLKSENTPATPSMDYAALNSWDSQQ